MPVTVVVATMDRRDRVVTTLDRPASLPERPPVVLVDNGSTDGTADAVGRAHPELVVLEPGRNLGAAGRTLGVEAAQRELVAFADDDSWWAPGALSRRAEHFAQAPRLGLLAARVLVGPEGRLDPVCVELAESSLPRQEVERQVRLLETSARGTA